MFDYKLRTLSTLVLAVDAIFKLFFIRAKTVESSFISFMSLRATELLLLLADELDNLDCNLEFVWSANQCVYDSCPPELPPL